MHKNFLKKGSLLKRGKLIATVGTITGFTIKGAKKLRVEFGSAVAEASKASLSVKRGSVEVSGLKQEWDADNKGVNLLSDTILPAGDYTALIDANGTPATLKVEAERVEKVEIKDQPVLTGTSEASKDEGRSNDEAYIYYDVKNQYDESIRERTTVNWSITSCDASRDNKNLGLVVAHRKNDREIFTYGTELHVTAVCIKDGTTKTDNKTLKIGEMQAIDKVEYKGFSKRLYHDRTLDRKNAKDIQKDVPADFAKGTWALLYQSYDQNGNMLEPAKDNISSAKEGAKLTFISDQPTLVMNDFEDGEIYKVNEGEVTAEYSSVNIEPGMYIDRETKVGLKAISTRTGNKNEEDFTIGETQRLQSFKIDVPSHVVADGDVVELPFTATDTAGRDIKDYKTIARSSNIISFSASEGTLELTEDNDGNAVLRWYDADKYRFRLDANGNNTGIRINPYMDGANNGIIINDNVDRTVSLTAVVTGKESASNTTTLAVSDMRRPASIEDVKFGRDGNDMVIAGFEKQEVDIAKDIVYTDQYGKTLTGDVYGTDNRPQMFWDAALVGGIRGYNYSIRAKQLSGTHPIFGNINSNSSNNNSNNDNPVSDNVTNWWGGSSDVSGSSTVNPDVINLQSQGTLDIHHNARYTANNNGSISNKLISEVSQATVRYSLVESEKTNNSRYNDIGKARTETYTIVPLSKVSDFTINTVKDKLGIKTSNTEYPNGSYIHDIGNTDYASHLMGAYAKPVNGSTGDAINIKTTNKTDIGKPANEVEVKAKYQGNTLTVPYMYISSTAEGPWGKIKTDTINEKENTSGSALSVSSDADNERYKGIYNYYVSSEDYLYHTFRDNSGRFDFYTKYDSNGKYIESNCFFSNGNLYVNDSYSNKNKVKYYLNIPYLSSKYTYEEDKDYNYNNYKRYNCAPSDKYVFTINQIKKNTIKWQDLYNVNTARYERKDAYLKLQLFIGSNPSQCHDNIKFWTDNDDNRYLVYKDDNDNIKLRKESETTEYDVLHDSSTKKYYFIDGTNKVYLNNNGYIYYLTKVGESEYIYSKNEEDKKDYYNGTVVDKYITISDEEEDAKSVKFLNGAESKVRSDGAVINNAGITAMVYDQYDQEYAGRDILYTVSDYKEDLDKCRLEKNYTIEKNGYNNSKITGVELGDSYTLTAKVKDTEMAATIKLTVGGDDKAKIISNKVMSESDEYKLRNDWLGYNR